MKQYLLAASVIATAVSASPEPIVLAERGLTAEYSIVIPADASPTHRQAAEELRDFTEKATGVALPVVTAEGVSALPRKAIVLEVEGQKPEGLKVKGRMAERLNVEAFRLHAEGERLHVTGGGESGVLYGVYELLERFAGCRWYASWHTVVPKRDRFEVPADMDETHSPAFAMREPFWFDVRMHPEFAARLRVNSHQYGGRTDARYGGDPWRFGGGLPSAHTFEKLLPPGEYFDAHPEYFSLSGGRRLREKGQLCLTNPDVLRIVTSNLLGRIRHDPGAMFYSVSQNDCNGWCECPSCKAVDDEEGSHSGTLVRFVNAVAEAVEAEFPDAIIETLAYGYTTRPPRKTRLRHNVVPCLCSIGCDFSRPIDESPFAANAAFRECIEGWGSICDFLYVWDYTTDFANYPAPWANVYSLQGNIRFFRRNNVMALFAQGAYQGRHADFAELKAWLLAKWMWDPDLPMGPLLDDFFAGYYGAGAPFVREYFEKLHRLQRDHSRSTGHPLLIFDSVANPALDDGFLAEASELWRKAEAATAGDPATSYNVRMGAFSVDYARMERGFKLLDLTRGGGAMPPSEAQALAHSLLGRMDEARNIRLAETPRDDIVLRWRSIAEAPRGLTPADRGELEESAIGILAPGRWGEFVEDPAAGDGKALKLFNTHYEWCVQFPLLRVAFEPGAKYRVRARIRVDSWRDGAAFSAGVYDMDEHKSRGQVSLTTSQTPCGYAWYDILEWVPKGSEYLWIAPGTFGDDGKSSINAVYIDKVEFARAGQDWTIAGGK